MSLFENKNNNNGIKQLNQISKFTENQINDKKNNSNKEENEEGEEDEDEEGDDDNNISEIEYIEEEDEEKEQEEIEEENLSLLSLYKYKLKYDERIIIYPRPKNNFIIFKNSNLENYFFSDLNNIGKRPSIRANFINIEESNSSIKLIRPSQYIIPNNIKIFYNTLNLFGLNVEPFSLDEKQNSFEFIQKINIQINNNRKILRCSNCNAIYHKLNFHLETISDNDYLNKYKYFCLICKKYEEFLSIKNSEEYYKDNRDKIISRGKIFEIPDVKNYKPSIEYIIENKDENNYIKNIIQIIILDLSNKDFLKFIYQTLIEIIGDLCEKNKKNLKDVKIKYVLIAYDYNGIYFIYLNKLNRAINISIMRDLKNPFCPVEPIKLFCSSKEFLELLKNFCDAFLNKIEQEFSYRNIDIINNIIESIFNLIKVNKFDKNNNNIYYYHMIFFSMHKYFTKIDLFKENKLYNIFLSFFLVSKKFNNSNIPFVDSINIHNIKLYYFPIEFDDSDDINIKYQEIKLILTKILNIKNYIYNIYLNICYDKKIFKNIFNNDKIYINFFPNKIFLNKIYILPQKGNPSLFSSIYLQYNLEYYTFIDRYKHIRVLTFVNKVSNESIEIYKSFDEEVLFRLTLAYHMNELNLSKNNFNSINKLYQDILNKNDKLFSKLIKNIINKMNITFAKIFKNSFEKKGIFIPMSLKLFPLYFFSFIKQITNGQNLNLLNLIYDCKLKVLMKNIYPNLINLRYKSKLKKEIFFIQPLSIEFFNKTQLLLLDNGFTISLLINSEIKDNIKAHYLIKNDKSEKIYFKAESNIINDIIKNRPIKIINLNDNIILNKKFLNIFIEDKLIENVNEEIENGPKIELNNEYIQNDICYSEFYEILSQNIYEFID
jgi:hypothetical protein